MYYRCTSSVEQTSCIKVNIGISHHMNFSNVISSVEAHAAGCPLRVITGGFPVIPGNTVVEKTQYLRDEMDHLRTAVLFEPRGHSGMCATVITESSAPGADIGMLILEPQGYVPMCGHCTIATCTVLVETGMVQVEEPVTKINLETLAGLDRRPGCPWRAEGRSR